MLVVVTAYSSPGRKAPEAYLAGFSFTLTRVPGGSTLPGVGVWRATRRPLPVTLPRVQFALGRGPAFGEGLAPAARDYAAL
jgi:hypothetical protein